SGFTGSYGQALITVDDKYIIADGRYFEQLKTQSPDFEVIDNKAGMEETIQSLIEEHGLSKVGIEAEDMNVNEYLALNKGAVSLIPTANLIEKQRMIKDKDEVAKIKKAGEISDLTYEHILKFI